MIQKAHLMPFSKFKKMAATVLRRGRAAPRHVDIPPIAHGPEGINAVGHRQYVGGLWDEIGKLQFDFLVANGLQPQHTFLDVACGCLRAGVHLIPYLQTGHYLGIDKEADLLRAGIDQELGRELFESKRPELIVSDAFEFERFALRPTHAIAQSLFTHLPPPTILDCLRKLRAVIQHDGVFYATYFETATPIVNPPTAHDHGLFYYTRTDMERFGTKTGWHVGMARPVHRRLESSPQSGDRSLSPALTSNARPGDGRIRGTS
jgi:hypothetical protein